MYGARGLEATPVGDYSGAVTSASEGVEIASTCVGHLPAEGRDLMLRCCAGLAERGLGIGQFGLQKPLRSGVAEYVLSLKICEWGSGSAFMSAADGAPGAVGPMASMSWCRPADGQGVIGRLGCIGETCFKEIRFQNGCSGREDLRPAREGESLQVQHEEMCVF